MAGDTPKFLGIEQVGGSVRENEEDHRTPSVYALCRFLRACDDQQ